MRDGSSPGSAWRCSPHWRSAAPLGTAIYSAGGFASVAIAATLIPLVTILLIAPLSPVLPQHGTKPPLKTVAAGVWLPGFGSALSSIGFGAIIAFGSLLAAQRGWSPVWLVFTAFAVSLVAARLLLGHVPDQLGGARVALVCALIEAAGLALIWLAAGRVSAAAGAALAGFGYSLVYPGLGVEAVRRAPPQSRGLAMGAYTIFLDVALGFGTPVLGLIAGRFGLDTAFLVSALIALGAATISIRLLFRKERAMPHVIVKLWPGKSEKQKAKLAEEITKAVMSVLNYGEGSVSVAMEEVRADDWMDKVYKPDILGKPKLIYKKPGYSSV